MQQKERKGAWVLFVAILLFGAIVWGYGGYERDKEKRAAEEIKLENIEENEALSEDSVNTAGDSTTSKKGKRKRVQSKSVREKRSVESVRDIRSDTISHAR